MDLIEKVGNGSSNCGTKRWSSFENGKNADVFSLGIILAWLMGGNYKIWSNEIEDPVESDREKIKMWHAQKFFINDVQHNLI